MSTGKGYTQFIVLSWYKPGFNMLLAPDTGTGTFNSPLIFLLVSFHFFLPETMK